MYRDKYSSCTESCQLINVCPVILAKYGNIHTVLPLPLFSVCVCCVRSGSSCSTGVGSRSQLMQGVLLHILADTLGSVGVIVSAFLVSQFRWMIADPLCSMFIAILILISVYPLLKESISVLMQRVPHALDGQLQSCFQRVSALDGVYSVQVRLTYKHYPEV